MSDVFGSVYAGGYDAIYSHKDYPGECDLLERVWGQRGTRVHDVLDLGCGTGGHAVELARRGYSVVGVDASPEMVALAEAKETDAGFVVSTIEDLDLGRTFDAAIMMFNVLGYQPSLRQATAACAGVRRHVEEGAPFVFDFWYGPAVLSDRPVTTFREIPIPTGAMLRATSTKLDVDAQTCDVAIDVWQIEDRRLTARATEHHLVRFFFVEELRQVLASAGFELVRVGAFPDFEQPPSEASWSATGVARATA